MNSRWHLGVAVLLAIFVPRISQAFPFTSVSSTAPVYYIPVTLTNSQTSVTSANLQELVSVNSNTNSAKYAANLANVNWQDSNGNVLPSWLESGETNTSTASKYWINLGSNTIAASGGQFTIYQVIYPTGINAMNGTTTGAEPNYTGTYAQYDNGTAVFSNYWNFSGTSLPAGWSSVIDGGGTATVNNGLSLSNVSTSDNVMVVTTSMFNVPIIESNISVSSDQTTSTSITMFFATVVPTTTGGDLGFQSDYRFDNDFGTTQNRIVKDVAAAGSAVTLVAGSFTAGIWTATWNATGSQKFSINYGSIATGADSSLTQGPAFLGVAAVKGGLMQLNWFRSRSYPPSGTQPAAAAGNLSSATNQGFVYLPF